MCCYSAQGGPSWPPPSALLRARLLHSEPSLGTREGRDALQPCSGDRRPGAVQRPPSGQAGRVGCVPPPTPLTHAGCRAEGRPLTEALGRAPLSGALAGDQRSDPRRVRTRALQHEGRLPEDLSCEGRVSRWGRGHGPAWERSQRGRGAGAPRCGRGVRGRGRARRGPYRTGLVSL